jgi:hypothetical protein
VPLGNIDGITLKFESCARPSRARRPRASCPQGPQLWNRIKNPGCGLMDNSSCRRPKCTKTVTHVAGLKCYLCSWLHRMPACSPVATNAVGRWKDRPQLQISSRGEGFLFGYPDGTCQILTISRYGLQSHRAAMRVGYMENQARRTGTPLSGGVC